MIIGILILMYLVYAMSKGNLNFLSDKKQEQTPEQILKERFVKGDIDESTYLNMLTVLNNH